MLLLVDLRERVEHFDHVLAVGAARREQLAKRGVVLERSVDEGLLRLGSRRAATTHHGKRSGTGRRPLEDGPLWRL